MDFPNFFGTAGGSRGQQQPQQHLTYDLDYDVAQQLTAMTTDQHQQHPYPPHFQQPTGYATANLQQQQQQRQNAVEQENQLLRQRLEQVQAQMQAAQQQCLILQQQQGDERKRPAVTDHRHNAKRNKKRKQAAAAAEEEETESDDEEEEVDDGDDNDDDNDGEEEDEEESNSDDEVQKKSREGKSTFGNRKDPIKTPVTGMIDGRSNAKQAFEERCNILRQYIAENGHANVPHPSNKKLPPKWQYLAVWMEKQFKSYRGMKKGKGFKHLGCGNILTPERVQMLRDLGVNLDARTFMEEAVYQFHEVQFPKLQQFHATYGHCCVPAVLNIHVGSGSSSVAAAAAAATINNSNNNSGVAIAAQFLEPAFKSWVHYNRVNLRNALAYDLKMQHEQQQQQQQQDVADDDNNAATTTATAEGDSGPVEPSDNDNIEDSITNTNNKEAISDMGNEEEQHPQEQNIQQGSDANTNAVDAEIDGNGNNTNKSPIEKQKRIRREGIERADLKRSYWTDEMTQKLQSLNCPWMNEVCENEIKTYFKEIHENYLALTPAERKRLIGASFLTFPLLNNLTWYENVELFRKYVHQHDGSGLVPVAAYDSMMGPGGRLGRFVKDQRKLYDAIQAGSIPTHPIVEQNFALLESIGFVFDAETIRKDEERRIQEKMNQARAAKEKDSPWVKLEQDRKLVQEAKTTVSQAKAAVNEAQKALAQANRELAVAQKRVRDQEEVVANDPLGKIVIVKNRGDKKPGGRGRVLYINTVKIVQQDVAFYDVEYIDDDQDKEEEGQDDEGDEATKVPRREYSVDGMFVTFEDARFNNNGTLVVVAAAARKPKPLWREWPENNLRRSSRKQQKQQSVLAPGFHNLMQPPNAQTDDYEDGMSMCI